MTPWVTPKSIGATMQTPRRHAVATPGGARTPLSVGISVDLTSLESRDSCAFECSVLENISILKHRARLLLVTCDEIVVCTPNPFKRGEASVMEVWQIEDLDKLRFKRGANGVLSLTFKHSRECKFLMPNAYDCVEYIKATMSRRGIEGSHTTKMKGSLQQIQSAEAFLETTKDLMSHFAVEPSVSLIQEIMELLRESAERFGAQNDDRYMLVVQEIKSFLQREDVTNLLQAGTRPGKVPVEDVAPPPSDPPPASEAIPATPPPSGDLKPFGLNLVELGAARKAPHPASSPALTSPPSPVPASVSVSVSTSPSAGEAPPPGHEVKALHVKDEVISDGGDEIALELKKDLETMTEDFSLLLETFQASGGNDGDGGNEEFSLADLDSLMLEHGIRGGNDASDNKE